jgi:hypothetical protein
MVDMFLNMTLSGFLFSASGFEDGVNSKLVLQLLQNLLCLEQFSVRRFEMGTFYMRIIFRYILLKPASYLLIGYL